MAVESHSQQLITPFERSGGKQSATYEELISFYSLLDSRYETVYMEEAGLTDVIYPLHVVYFSNDRTFDVDRWKALDKLVILINNGIHPGEPDGIDASMMLLRDAAEGKIKIPDNVVLAVVPVFNIGGMLNRNSHSRANQNGPEAYGFRGSAQNLDLNRDFIKMDAMETRSLVRLMHRLDPDLFIDNHVSNGADYQHVMTLLATQYNKLGAIMGRYLNDTLVPQLYSDMKKKGYDLVPYVNHFGHTPEKGWTAFYEGPRFASGYAALFQIYGFVPETHMLKPFDQRVRATYELMRTFIKTGAVHVSGIRESRKRERALIAAADALPLAWKSDTTRKTMVAFKGFEAAYKASGVSGQPRLYYDRSKPFTRNVSYYDYYQPVQQVQLPRYYVIQQGWNRAIDILRVNGIELQQLSRDTTLLLGMYYIDKYETVSQPYEGHYLHKNVTVKKVMRTIKLMKGDYLIATSQPGRRYLAEVLEPTASDALFAWGFFDAVLQQKEYYSDYVFEDEAAALLQSNRQLGDELNKLRAADSAFAADGAAQLDFVYRHSDYYEPVHMRYPVFRIE